MNPDDPDEKYLVCMTIKPVSVPTSETICFLIKTTKRNVEAEFIYAEADESLRQLGKTGPNRFIHHGPINRLQGGFALPDFPPIGKDQGLLLW